MFPAFDLFIGLEPSPPWLVALTDAQAQICDRFDDLYQIEADYFHLSLMHLGELDGERIAQIMEVLDRAMADCDPFELQIGPLDFFRSPRNRHTVVARVRGDVRELDRLRHAIHRAFAPLGFPSAKNSFTPHITLAKWPDAPHDDAIDSLRRALARTIVALTEPFRVGRISLIHSPGRHREAHFNQGVRYGRIASAMVGIRERGC